MNDEIKEILDKLKEIKELEIYITPKTTKKLLDYITNLQHTEDLYNQLLKDYDELQQKLTKEEESWQIVATKFFNNAVDYKARIEKAIECLNGRSDE